VWCSLRVDALQRVRTEQTTTCHCAALRPHICYPDTPLVNFHRDLLLFIIGATYTREQVHAALGGSTQACIPTRNGLVLSICVTPKLNPRAPRELLCGVGPIMAKTGAMLAASSYRVPFFIKRRINEWEYMGLYRTVASYASGSRFNEMVTGSGRSPDDVSIAIELQP